MAEHQVVLGFALAGHSRDVDLLERLGRHLEEIAGETGPVAAIEGERYIAELTVASESPLGAGEAAVEIFIEAMNRALAETGDELAEGAFDQYRRYFDQVHVDREPVLA
jgi:hypothetical protein